MPFTANSAVGARPPAQFQVKRAAALPADLRSVRFRAASMLSQRTSPREEFAPKRPSFPCCNRRALRPYRRGLRPNGRASGCSSGVEHNLAKVGVGRSNRLTRSSFLTEDQANEKPRTSAAFSRLRLASGPPKSPWTVSRVHRHGSRAKGSSIQVTRSFPTACSIRRRESVGRPSDLGRMPKGL